MSIEDDIKQKWKEMQYGSQTPFGWIGDDDGLRPAEPKQVYEPTGRRRNIYWG